MKNPVQQPVLVLNASYEPLATTSAGRAFSLLQQNKAEIISIEEGGEIRSARQAFPLPLVIRLLRYVRVRYDNRRRRPTRALIFTRDERKCVYCDDTRQLTLDHVQPLARGGDHSWENIVTCCHRCNQKKGDRTPVEAGMSMRVQPTRPTHELTVLGERVRHESWLHWFQRT
jgi:5-methylcytosine-specific restriction endonuclease McrA